MYQWADMGSGGQRGLDVESTPTCWSTNHKRYTSEKPHEKQCSFWVDNFGHHQLARELFDSTRQRRVKDQRNKIEL